MCLVCFPVCLALFCLSSGLLGLGHQEVHAEVEYAGGDVQVGCSSGGSARESVEGSWFSSLLSLFGVMVMAQKTFQAEVECSFHKKKWEWFVYSQIACLIWWASPWPANDWESKMLFGSILLREQGHVLISRSKTWIQTHGLHLCATQRPLGPACWLPYGLERIPTSYVPRLWRLRSRGSTILLNGRRRLVRFGQKQQRAGKQRGRRGLNRRVITMTDLWRVR